jgi:hypothetical protein
LAFTPEHGFVDAESLMTVDIHTIEEPQRRSGPTKPPPKPPGLSSVLARNIETLQRRRADEEARPTFEERLAGAITRFTGSMRFV